MNKIIKRIISSNRYIFKNKLCIETFGNTSEKYKNNIYIKPSGIHYNKLNLKNISIVDIKTNKLSKGLKPSVDLDIHKQIYENFGSINAICHTHSKYACIWAQSGKPIPCLGTTHADYWKTEIPITRELSKKEVENNYEKSIGISITDLFTKNDFNISECPGVLVNGHGSFTWGKDSNEASKKAYILEHLAELAFKTRMLNNDIKLKKYLINKHFNRKHGKKKYYGQ